MVLRQLTVSFDNPQATYYEGQTVSGRLFVNLDGGKRIRGIEVTFRGEAEVRWTEVRAVQEAAGKVRPLNQHFRGHEVYLHSSHYLVGGPGAAAGGGDVYLQPGDHCYPFSTVLPPGLPTSYEGQMGHVRYTVWLTLRRPWKFDHQVKAAFSVVSAVDLNAVPGLAEPVVLQAHRYMGWPCCRSGPLSLSLSLPASGFVSGQDIIVSVIADNMSREPVSSVSFDLEKISTFHARLGRSTKSRMDNTVVLERCLGGVEAGGTAHWSSTVRVPPLPPSLLANCGVIDLSYILTVRAEVPSVNKEVVAACDILIGTIPLKVFWPKLSVVPLTPLSVGSGDSDIKTETPSPYPELPPPVYCESALGPASIRDPTDSQWLCGDLSFCPRYPCYYFD